MDWYLFGIGGVILGGGVVIGIGIGYLVMRGKVKRAEDHREIANRDAVVWQKRVAKQDAELESAEQCAADLRATHTEMTLQNEEAAAEIKASGVLVASLENDLESTQRELGAATAEAFEKGRADMKAEIEATCTILPEKHDPATGRWVRNDLPSAKKSAQPKLSAVRKRKG